MAIVPNVIAQHVEEACFSWLLREAAVGEPHYRIADLAKLDDKVEAHLDGLRIAGEEGWELCQAELKWEEPGEVFAAAVLALDSGDAARINQVVEIGCSAPELERGLVSALGWTPSQHVPPLLEQLINSTNPAARRVGVAGRAIRREDPGHHLTRLLADADPRVRARSLRAMAELGKQDLRDYAYRALNDEDPSCQFWATWAAARLGERSSTVTGKLTQFAFQPGPLQERAVKMAVRVLEPHAAKQLLSQLWQNPATLRAAAIGIGAVGDPQHITAAFQLMPVKEVARVAGEAFSMITGVDLAYQDLEQDRPEGFESGPTEDAADENVALDADENLPWPNPALVAKWWQTNSQRFTPGHRYLCGREINPGSLPQTLYEGFQRQRASAAMELALLNPRQPMFEVRARGDWQQQLLPRWFSQLAS